MIAPVRGHEPRDLRVRTVLIFAVGLTVFGAISHVAIGRLLSRWTGREDRRHEPPPFASEPRSRPTPRLEEDDARELEAIRRREAEELGTAGWVDRDKGLVRIPIERAMEEILRRGLPTRRTP